MADHKHKQENAGERSGENDRLGLKLDGALAKYAAVEPRAGLEERVLANLRSKRDHVGSRAWWIWPAAAALAVVVVIVVTASLGWRSRRSTPDAVAHHPAAPISDDQQTGKKEAKNSGRSPTRSIATGKRLGMGGVPHSRAVAAAPKLEQFPSPRPLNEQEKILASYVSQFREQAVLVARARAEELQRDQAEEMGVAPASSGSTDSDR